MTGWGITSADRYSPRCRSSTSMASATASSAGWSAAATCAWWSGSSTSSARQLVRGVPADAVLRRADDVRAAARRPRRTARARSAARMRLFVSGSAPLPAQVHEDFAALFGHVILERYGMTETLMNVSNPLVGERRPGTRGAAAARRRPCASSTTRSRDVGDDQTGELWVKRTERAARGTGATRRRRRRRSSTAGFAPATRHASRATATSRCRGGAAT